MNVHPLSSLIFSHIVRACGTMCQPHTNRHTHRAAVSLFDAIADELARGSVVVIVTIVICRGRYGGTASTRAASRHCHCRLVEVSTEGLRMYVLRMFVFVTSRREAIACQKTIWQLSQECETSSSTNSPPERTQGAPTLDQQTRSSSLTPASGTARLLASGVAATVPASATKPCLRKVASIRRQRTSYICTHRRFVRVLFRSGLGQRKNTPSRRRLFFRMPPEDALS